MVPKWEVSLKCSFHLLCVYSLKHIITKATAFSKHYSLLCEVWGHYKLLCLTAWGPGGLLMAAHFVNTARRISARERKAVMCVFVWIWDSYLWWSDNNFLFPTLCFSKPPFFLLVVHSSDCSLCSCVRMSVKRRTRLYSWDVNQVSSQPRCSIQTRADDKVL